LVDDENNISYNHPSKSNQKTDISVKAWLFTPY
jgi:hypothetical protein